MCFQDIDPLLTLLVIYTRFSWCRIDHFEYIGF